MWGAWGQMVGIGTAVFTGYAIWLGATDSEIAYFVSIASFACFGQILSSTFAGRIRRKKAFIFGIGAFEILFRFSVILIPLAGLESGKILVMGTLLGLGLMCGHTVSPVYSGWLATVIPEDIRARFTGRQTIANLIAGLAASYLAGWYVDLFPVAERYGGFLIVFAGATILGLGGYFNLMRVPFLDPETDAPEGNLLTPFRHRRFRNLLLFFLTWNFALGIASPFYSVFMLRTLHLSYTTVAILSSLFMAAMVAGYKVWGGLVDRYGSKAVLQILVPPTLLMPVIWVFNRHDNYLFIPLAMLLSGLLHSGILVSVNPLLLGTLPQGRGKTAYFAAWSTAINLTYALAPILGSYLVRTFEPVHLSWFGYSVGNLQLVFLVSSGALIFPVLLLRAVEGTRETTVGKLLNTVGRGNLLSYVYGSLLYTWASSEEARARAARQMGRSRSPMALEHLIKALEDASPEVRRQAAHGLGEARAQEAVDPLVEELRDAESDIRTEAAEALGKIGDPRVVDPLVDALDDPDTRVRISAIRALSDIGGEEAGELLFWMFAEGFDRTTFPTLADTLGQIQDFRIVQTVLKRLIAYRSPAIRLQLLNSVCQALGARRRFYQTISQDELTRAERMDEMLKQTRRAVGRARALRRDIRAHILAGLDAVHKAFDTDDGAQLAGTVRKLSESLEKHIDEDAVDALGSAAASRIGAVVLAIRTFLDEVEIEASEGAHTVFLVVCIWCIGNALSAR